jgi:hypothetical protein
VRGVGLVAFVVVDPTSDDDDCDVFATFTT